MQIFENEESLVVEHKITKAFENPQETTAISKNLIEIDNPQSPTHARVANTTS